MHSRWLEADFDADLPPRPHRLCQVRDTAASIHRDRHICVIEQELCLKPQHINVNAVKHAAVGGPRAPAHCRWRPRRQVRVLERVQLLYPGKLLTQCLERGRLSWL